MNTPSGSQVERTVRIARRHEAVEDARRVAELATSECSAECRQAVSLAVAELSENVIKYGAGATDSDPHAGTIGVSVDDDMIRIRAINQVGSAEDARKVFDLVSRISVQGGDIRDLYRSRMVELFSNPTIERAQLGLMRTVFEGGFRLSCYVRGAELEIVAERACRIDA